MRLVQNSFIGGEISPELFGRHDLEAYFHAAKNITNFTVQKTGGLRKRHGTQLLWHVSGTGDVAYRAIPYFYNRTHSACVLLYRKPDSTTAYCRFCVEGEAPGTENTISVLSLASADALKSLHVKQVGDTLFLTAAGRKTVRGTVNYTSRSVTWQEMQSAISVAAAPAITLVATNFSSDTSQGYRASTRTYGIIGVKNSVYSAIRSASCRIYLPWVAGATVTITFSPNWSAHDYYILCVRQAGQWGVLDTIYPSSSSSVRGDLTWANTSFSSTGTINEVSYTAGTTTPSTAFKNDPNATSNGYNTNAAIIPHNATVSFAYKSANSVATNLQLWLGGLVRRTADTSQIDTVSTPGETTVTLYKSDGTTRIASWTVNALYSTSAQTLAIDTPVVNSGATYYLKFENSGGEAVVLRGAVLGVPGTSYSLVDDNIMATDVAGVMEALTVGDTGMDCAVVDVWEQRLVFAASAKMPFTLWFSRTGDVNNFYTDRPQTADSAFSVTIAALTSSRILHMVTSRWFLLLTESGEYSVDTAGNSGFSFATIAIRRTSSVGAHEAVEPVVTASSVLFVAADGRTVYDIAYSLEQDNIVPVERSMLAHHMTESSRIRKIAFAKFPEPQLLCLLDDGTIAAMTYLPEEKVAAWSRFRFAGGGLKCVDIMAPSSIREGAGLEGSSDMWLVFESDAKPGDVWIERMRVNGVGDVQPDGIAKCADHCGYDASDYPVSGEDPQTDVAASVTTVRPEIKDFNTIGLYKNIHDCVVRLNRSGKVTIRPDADYFDGTSGAVQDGSEPVEDAGTVALVTKDVRVLPYAYNNTDGRMVVTSADRWPCEILSVLFNVEVAGDDEEGGA